MRRTTARVACKDVRESPASSSLVFAVGVLIAEKVLDVLDGTSPDEGVVIAPGGTQ